MSDVKLRLVTGLCLAGWHEGGRPRTRCSCPKGKEHKPDCEGAPIKTCAMHETCPCKCHSDLDELFALSGKPRELVVNPDYVPVTTHHLFVRPTVAAPSILSGETVEKGAVISPLPGVVPGEAVKEFSDTKSGRLAHGQLEYWVKQAIDVWVIETHTGQRMPPCTPSWIAEQISIAEGIAEPQLGGINHIFRRWEEIGIAKFETKPARFAAYTDEAIEKGIDRMRDAASRAKKNAMAF